MEFERAGGPAEDVLRRRSPPRDPRISMTNTKEASIATATKNEESGENSGARTNAEEGNRGERERPEKETGGRVHRVSTGAEYFAEGQAVRAWHKSGCWDRATIVQRLPNGKYRVAWADGMCMLHLCMYCLCDSVHPSALHSALAHRVEKLASVFKRRASLMNVSVCLRLFLVRVRVFVCSDGFVTLENDLRRHDARFGCQALSPTP